VDEYCSLLHNGLVIILEDNVFNVKPCCMYAKSTSVLKLSSDPFNELFINARNLNKNNILPSNCNRCKGTNTLRDSSNELLQVHSVDTTGPMYIEVTLDYTCDSACMICNSRFSSGWVRYSNSSDNKILNNITFLKDVLSQFDLSNLRKIKILGGEPFMSANNIVLVEHLLENVDPIKVGISYNTNGSVIPSDKIIKLLQKFSFVEMNFSIDDTGAAYEYQRYPSKWTQLQNNIEVIMSRMSDNTFYSVQKTISLLNIHSRNVEEWFANSAITTLNKHFASGVFSLHNVSIRHYNWLAEHHLDTLQYFDSNRVDSNSEIVNFVEDQDLKRNMDINAWFPEFLSFYRPQP